MTPAQAKQLRRGDRVQYAGQQVTVESVGRLGNFVRIWREDRQISGRQVADRVASAELEPVA